jgi:glucosamine--fructose-6-phosphate aminotransferase (isomerizing)
MDPVIAKLTSAGADVLRVGPDDGLPVATDGVDPELSPILEILPLQQLALRLAVNRGSDPDAPRGLRKVTETY